VLAAQIQRDYPDEPGDDHDREKPRRHQPRGQVRRDEVARSDMMRFGDGRVVMIRPVHGDRTPRRQDSTDRGHAGEADPSA